MLRSGKAVLAAGKMASIVDFAIETHREIEALQQELDIVKPFLREEGLRLHGVSTENIVEIQGNLGCAVVTGVKPSPRAKRGMDLASLEKTLRPEVFHTLFIKKEVVTIEIRAGYQKMLPMLTIAERKVLDAYIELASTPRVNLPT